MTTIDPGSKALSANFGERLRTARLKAGLTLKQLGAYLDISTQQVSNFENRGDLLDAPTLFRVADLLCEDPRYLATGEVNDHRDHGFDSRTWQLARAFAVMTAERRDALATLLGIQLD